MNLYRDLSKKIRVWDSSVGQFEELAAKQLHDVASLPVVEGVRAMPDSHWGAWSLRRVGDRPQKGGYSCSGGSRYRVWNAGLQDQPQFPPSS